MSTGEGRDRWRGVATTHEAKPGRQLLLRVFYGDEEDGQSSPPPGSDDPNCEWTLPELFERWYLPRVLKDPSQRNVQDYRHSLAIWAAAVGQVPVGAIDDLVLEAFAGHLRQRMWRGKPLAQNTRRNHSVRIQALLNSAGPWGPEQKKNKRRAAKRGLFGADQDGDARPIPSLEIPAVETKPAQKVFSVEQVARLIEAAGRIRRPQDIPGIAPEMFWPALYRFLARVGLRIGSTLMIRRDMFQQLDLYGGCWIEVPPEIYKGRRRERFYCPPWILEALEQIRTPDARIFPWPHDRDLLHEIRRAIEDLAGVPHYGFQGVRKCFSSELARHDPSLVSSGRALGHKIKTVAGQHYNDERGFVELINALPAL